MSCTTIYAIKKFLPNWGRCSHPLLLVNCSLDHNKKYISATFCGSSHVKVLVARALECPCMYQPEAPNGLMVADQNTLELGLMPSTDFDSYQGDTVHGQGNCSRGNLSNHLRLC